MYQNLSRRLESIEEKVCGSENPDVEKMMKIMKVVDQTLHNFASKRERFKQVFQKAPQISEMIQAGYEDTIIDNDEFKSDYLSARESDILETCHNLENVSELSKLCLDDNKTVDGLSKLSDHNDRMGKLQQVQIQDMEKVQRVSGDMRQLLQAYNEIISAVSAQFVRWDLELTALEERKERERHE